MPLFHVSLSFFFFFFALSFVGFLPLVLLSPWILSGVVFDARLAFLLASDLVVESVVISVVSFLLDFTEERFLVLLLCQNSRSPLEDSFLACPSLVAIVA